jgi:hypothetical protein
MGSLDIRTEEEEKIDEVIFGDGCTLTDIYNEWSITILIGDLDQVDIEVEDIPHLIKALQKVLELRKGLKNEKERK